MLGKVFVFCSAAALVAGTAVGAVISNGDFETGDLTGWNASGIADVASAAELLTLDGVTGSFPTGQYVLEFGGGDQPDTGIVSQRIVTSIGHQYVLSFDYGKFYTGAATQAVAISVANVGDNASLLSQSISDPSGSSNLSDVMLTYTFSFVASGSETLVKFSDVSSGTTKTDGLLDNVSVVGVPEPADIELATVPLFASLLVRRRRNLKMI